MNPVAAVRRQYLTAKASLAELAHDIAGFAAVEFAMIVPVMIIMLLGCVEVSDASTVSLRVINISGSVADMVARCSNIADSDLNDIMRISGALLGKYSSEGLYVRVAELQADANAVVTVTWSYDSNHRQPLAAGAPYPNLPFGLITPGGSLVVVLASYNYRSPVAQHIHGPVKLQHTSYNAPRGNLAIPPPGAISCTY